jgi:tetratricopeptide (TPR) repeat protein
MDRTSNPRRVTVTLSLLSGLAIGLLASPAQGQDTRWRVLVPIWYNAADDDDGWGKDAAEETRDLLDELAKYRSVTKDELETQLDRYQIKEDALIEEGCFTARQLASQAGYELFVCASYVEHERGDGATVNASIVSPKDGTAFNIDQFDVDEPELAAQRILSEFQQYTELLARVTYCSEEIASENWQLAIERCNQALAIDSDHIASLYMRASAHLNLEHHQQALDGYQRVLELNNAHLEAMKAAGIVLTRMDRTDEAHAYFRDYLALNPGDAAVRLTLAIEASRAGDPAVALEMLEEGLETEGITEDDRLLATEYASQIAFQAAMAAAPAAITNSAPPEAVPYFEKAVMYSEEVVGAKGAETSPDVLTNTLNAYRLLGRDDDALRFGEQAVHLAPDNARVVMAYADVLNKAAQTDLAIEMLERAKQIDPAAQVNARRAVWELARDNMEGAWEAIQAVGSSQEMDQTRVESLLQSYALKAFQARAEDHAVAVRRIQHAREVAKTDKTLGMLDYFEGIALFEPLQASLGGAELPSVAQARAAKPQLQAVIQFMEGARRYTSDPTGVAQEGTRTEIVSASNQYIEMLDAIIERGGGM